MKKESLISSYMNTNYVVENEPRIVIRIGEKNAELDAFLNEKACNNWTFITAYNPYSQELSKIENEQRQKRLRDVLDAKGFAYVNGSGQSPTGDWPPEPSLFVLGISRVDASEIAKQFKQNAIVYGTNGCEPELVWCQ